MGFIFSTHDECCFSVFFFACSLLFFLLLLSFYSVQWACLEITHNAQPNKLTDSGMGHSVIRWRQYHLVWRWATTASLISCFLPSINTTPLLRKCLRHAGTWLPLPPSLPPFLPPTVYVSHPLLLKHAYRYCFQVLQRDIYRVLQHICRIEMPNAALFLFCFDVPLKKKNNHALHFFFNVSGLQGGARFWKSHLFTESLTSFHALLSFLDHRTIIKIVCIPIEKKMSSNFLWNAKKKPWNLIYGADRLHHKVFQIWRHF